ncbi:MAG: hypothetical protein HOZ81_07180, partial [Streptomyces sp.]|nr:hypothetical protein [Streptomyces sp.]
MAPHLVPLLAPPLIGSVQRRLRLHPRVVDVGVALAVFGCSLPGVVVTLPGYDPGPAWWPGVALAGVPYDEPLSLKLLGPAAWLLLPTTSSWPSSKPPPCPGCCPGGRGRPGGSPASWPVRPTRPCV